MSRFCSIRTFGSNFFKVIPQYYEPRPKQLCSFITCSRNSSFILNSSKKDERNLQEYKCHYTISQRFKGHSKWQNIAKTKMAKDMKKSRVFSKICNSIRRVVLEGGPDLKINSRLAALHEHAREVNMPVATFNRVVERTMNIELKQWSLEFLGPGGCLMVVEGEGETKNRFYTWVRKVLKKANCPFMSVENRIKQNFVVKGIIVVNGRNDDKPLDLDSALDVAVVSGAEDVEQNEDTSEIVFITDPDQLESVQTQVEKAQYKVDSAEIVYTPIAPVTLSNEDMEAVKRFLALVDEDEEILKVHHTVKDLEV